MFSFGALATKASASETCDSPGAAAPSASGTEAGARAARQFGGVGVMLDGPCVELKIESAAELSAEGPHAERALDVVNDAMSAWDQPQPAHCRITISAAPPAHVGLGTGTQLALAVAAGLRAHLQLPPLEAPQLAASVGRASRSSVGTHGFFHGGLIVEAGKSAGDQLGPLVCRVPVPDDWRFALLSPREGVGLSGGGEEKAFALLPAVDPTVSAQLAAEVMFHLAPAAQNADVAAFGESVFRFGRLAGECFAAVQGGAFASSQIADLVDTLRGWGVCGVGQSSWGPTVFAVLPSDEAASDLLARLRQSGKDESYDIRISRPWNKPAEVRVLS